MSETTKFGAERTQAGAATAFAVAAAFVALAGVPGLAGGATVVGAWYFLPATYAFALGHVALVAVFPEGSLASIAAVEIGLVALLFVSARSSERSSVELERPNAGASRRRAAAVVVGWLLLGGTLAWAGRQSLLDISLAATLLASATAFASYGLHRYQLVGLGKVSDQ